MRAEFEEKQYEIAASIELASGVTGHRVFSSGQLLENLLGYDSAADPDPDHVLWKLLKLPRPRGIVLLPQYWNSTGTPKGEKLPRSSVSVILQFKRPELMLHPNASQWSLWHEPFFRFTRRSVQHQVLIGLEKALENNALVRYASPAFSSLGMLELSQLTKTVLAKTGFVSPTDIGSHRTWTYLEPGLDGRGNPSGGHRRFQALSSLLESLEEAGGPQPAYGLSPHVADITLMSRTLRYRRPTVRKLVDPWMQRVERAALGLSVVELDALSDYVTVQSVVHKIQAN